MASISNSPTTYLIPRVANRPPGYHWDTIRLRSTVLGSHQPLRRHAGDRGSMSLDCRLECIPADVDPSVRQATESSRRSSSPGDVADDQDTAMAPTASVGSERRPQSSSITLSFLVTGAASVARLHPLLLGRQWYGGAVAWMSAAADGAEVVDGRGVSNGDDGNGCNGKICVPDFVWETTVTKDQRQRHRSARVLNRLNGAQVRVLFNRLGCSMNGCLVFGCGGWDGSGCMCMTICIYMDGIGSA